jgi:hypothetical protein
MTKLSKAQGEALKQHSADMQTAREALEKAVNEYNAAIDAAWKRVEDACTAYNEKLTAAKEFIESVETEIGEYIDERSDTWRATDKGSAYDAWKEQYSDAAYEMNEVDFSRPDELSLDDYVDVAELIGNVEDSPSV